MRLGQQGWHAACTHAAAAERGGTTIMVTPIAIDLLLSTSTPWLISVAAPSLKSCSRARQKSMFSGHDNRGTHPRTQNQL